MCEALPSVRLVNRCQIQLGAIDLGIFGLSASSSSAGPRTGRRGLRACSRCRMELSSTRDGARLVHFDHRNRISPSSRPADGDLRHCDVHDGVARGGGSRNYSGDIAECRSTGRRTRRR